jgi:ABC-type glycerol-3-phosphate transport system permease component
MKRTLPQSLALYGGLFLLVLIIGLPFWWVVTGSIKLPKEIISRTPTMAPHSFTLQHFGKLLQSTDFPAYLVNSLIVALFSTAFTSLSPCRPPMPFSAWSFPAAPRFTASSCSPMRFPPLSC